MKESHGKIRIALALEYPLLQQGGMEVLVRELVRRLSGQFEIILVSTDRNLEEIGEPYASLIAGHISWEGRARPAREAWELAAKLMDNHVKLAHFHGGIYDWQTHKVHRSPLFYLICAGVPCLLTNHFVLPLLEGYCNSKRPTWQKILLYPKTWLNKALIISRLQAEILVSKHDYERMRHLYPLSAGKLKQVYHSKLARSDRGLPMNQRQKTVLCLGAFSEHKGQLILTRAFASIAHLHPDWTLHLMGRSDTAGYLEEIEAIVDRTGLSERIRISPPHVDPSSVLETAAIFAMPSLREPLGLSLQEALYYGCASIGSDVGGIPELIEHEATGLLVPPGDAKALAIALDRLMSDLALRTRLSDQARQSIIDKGMLAEEMTKTYAHIYNDMIAGKSLFHHT